MFLGITGPLLILPHPTFHVGSLNADVALSCMLVVAGSGICAAGILPTPFLKELGILADTVHGTA